MEQKAEERTEELGRRVERHKGETQRELSEVKGEMEQIRIIWGVIARDARGKRTGEGKIKGSNGGENRGYGEETGGMCGDPV